MMRGWVDDLKEDSGVNNLINKMVHGQLALLGLGVAHICFQHNVVHRNNFYINGEPYLYVFFG